nr:hypothetical protein [uncultured organism]
MRSHPLFHSIIMPAALTLLACGPAHAAADTAFAPIDFSLRFPAALAKFSSYADVAASGGASAGSRYGSGINPASLDWQTAPDAPFAVSPQVSNVKFDHGASLRVATLSGAWSNAYGTFQPSHARVTNDGNGGDPYILADGDVTQVQWGKKLDSRVAVGLNVSRSQFRTRAGFGGQLAADGSSSTDSVRGGVLWALSPDLLAGLVADVASGHSDTSLLDPGCMCFVQARDTSRSGTARIGVSYRYAPQSSVYADYLVGRYRNGPASMVSRTAMAGAEHLVLPWLYLRAGVAWETRGAWGKSFGVGVMPSKTVSIDLALQRDMFPELHPEFGRASLANLSVSVAF